MRQRELDGGFKISQPTSVLHLFNGLNPSGMERMLLSAAKHSPIPISQVTIVGQGSSNPFVGPLRQAGYTVKIVPPLSTINGFRTFASLIRQSRPSVIHIHSEGTYAQAVFASRLASPRTPIIRSIHSIFRKKKMAAVYRRIVSLIADRHVASFVACSPEVRDFEHEFGRSTELVWNWVDDKFFQLRSSEFSSTDRTVSFMIVGNCSWIKNHTLALNALLAAAETKDFDFDLAHYGMEDRCDQAEQRILDDWHNKGRLSHRGPGDPIEGMKRRPTFLMPSLHEGMGVALAEAIVVGLPAIVADVPGLQWAKEFPNVRHAANNVEFWFREVTRASQALPETVDVSRFSARKGINSYFAIYKSALDHKGSKVPIRPGRS